MRSILLGAAATLLAVSAHAGGGFSVPVTPPGVTVEPALHISAMAAGMPATSTQGSFTDANGMALYTYAGDTTPGQSACTGDCATAWPALAAPADAKAVGDWTVQLGSFSDEANAKRLAQRAGTFGYKAEVSSVRNSGKTLYRVRVGPQATRAAADAAASALKAHGVDARVVSAR